MELDKAKLTATIPIVAAAVPSAVDDLREEPVEEPSTTNEKMKYFRKVADGGMSSPFDPDDGSDSENVAAAAVRVGVPGKVVISIAVIEMA